MGIFKEKLEEKGDFLKILRSEKILRNHSPEEHEHNLTADKIIISFSGNLIIYNCCGQPRVLPYFSVLLRMMMMFLPSPRHRHTGVALKTLGRSSDTCSICSRFKV